MRVCTECKHVAGLALCGHPEMLVVEFSERNRITGRYIEINNIGLRIHRSTCSPDDYYVDAREVNVDGNCSLFERKVITPFLRKLKAIWKKKCRLRRNKLEI